VQKRAGQQGKLIWRTRLRLRPIVLS